MNTYPRRCATHASREREVAKLIALGNSNRPRDMLGTSDVDQLAGQEPSSIEGT
jgi:hypothetical protein